MELWQCVAPDCTMTTPVGVRVCTRCVDGVIKSLRRIPGELLPAVVMISRGQRAPARLRSAVKTKSNPRQEPVHIGALDLADDLRKRRDEFNDEPPQWLPHDPEAARKIATLHATISAAERMVYGDDDDGSSHPGEGYLQMRMNMLPVMTAHEACEWFEEQGVPVKLRQIYNWRQRGRLIPARILEPTTTGGPKRVLYHPLDIYLAWENRAKHAWLPPVMEAAAAAQAARYDTQTPPAGVTYTQRVG
ncbi:hypothetical protein [Nesterenkonia rhizosphaerae]|uniref:Helix-turn-helix DNA binding domain protein n=1 Tax=Nesterenkonia rhizosphaerae TaxID=1348272 RepID=A0ABP9FZ78_9MICC